MKAKRVRYVHDLIGGCMGTLVRIQKGPRGGDCVVRWERTGIESEECLFNLRDDQGREINKDDFNE